MKLLRRLSLVALLFALLALVLGFTVLTLPRTADASRCATAGACTAPWKNLSTAGSSAASVRPSLKISDAVG
jgi:hypothetical protein